MKNIIYKKHKEENKILTLIFDIDDLSKNITDISRYINKGSGCEFTKWNLVIKNSFFNSNESLFMENEKLELNKLFVSDELKKDNDNEYNTFKDIKEHNDIEIDVDENSLLNPSMITKFRINKGLSDFCFDLD